MRVVFWATTLGFALIFSGCALFTSHFDAIRHQNFTQLKAFHVKFLEDWTEGSNKVWSETSVAEMCDRGDLKFREAYEYASSRDKADKSGSKAVKNLWSIFEKNCAKAAKKAFSKAYSTEMIQEVSKNYQYAIEGELSRVGGSE